LLKLDHESRQHRESIATPEEVKEFNRRTIITAQNYVFTRDQPETVSQQVAQLQNIFAGFSFDDLPAGDQQYQVQRFIPVSPAEGGNSV